MAVNPAGRSPGHRTTSATTLATTGCAHGSAPLPTSAGSHKRTRCVSMREYRSSEIRNIAVVGHGASGKTSLVDALAFVSGSSKRHGSVKDGTALTDYAAEETDRGYSINLGCAFAEWENSKINLIDTPGYLDFHGEAVAGLAAADGALCVVPG